MVLKRLKLLKLFATGSALLIIWYSCADHNVDGNAEAEVQINLRWLRSYETETKEDIEKGLAWSMSFLGASLPQGTLSSGIRWKNEKLLTLDVSALGFTTEAQQALKNIFRVLKTSEEYRLFGGIDIGRFTMLTLNSTNHYYAITGAKKTYSAFRADYAFDEKKAAVLFSTIAFGNRVIEISRAGNVHEVAFIAQEGEGGIENNSFVVKEYECMDIMPNGQLRFALYDHDGNLKTSASPDLTAAGKPAKCLWCHEIHLIAPFVDDHELSSYYSTEEFKQILQHRVDLIQAFRAELKSVIDFTKYQDHTKAELLYLSFMEPSVGRLSGEWGISTEEVKEKLRNQLPHPHHEFSFLGNSLYYRKDVENLSPFASVATPDDPREYSVFEPDFIHD